MKNTELTKQILKAYDYFLVNSHQINYLKYNQKVVWAINDYKTKGENINRGELILKYINFLNK